MKQLCLLQSPLGFIAYVQTPIHIYANTSFPQITPLPLFLGFPRHPTSHKKRRKKKTKHPPRAFLSKEFGGILRCLWALSVDSVCSSQVSVSVHLANDAVSQIRFHHSFYLDLRLYMCKHMHVDVQSFIYSILMHPCGEHS